MLQKDEIIIFIRDDTIVEYDNLIHKKLLDLDLENFVLVPFKHWHGGVCDRFFIADHLAIKSILSRLLIANEYIERRGYLNAEKIMHDCCKKNKINIFSANIDVKRIRSGKRVLDDSYFLPLHRPNELYRSLKALLRFKML